MLKKTFFIALLQVIPFSNCLKSHLFRGYIFLVIYGSFWEIDAFPLGLFSIHNFTLRNLKGNGNAGIYAYVYGDRRNGFYIVQF